MSAATEETSTLTDGAEVSASGHDVHEAQETRPLDEVIDATTTKVDEPVDTSILAIEKDDIDRLLEEPVGPITLQSGTVIEIKPLKLREFLKLLKILTRGGGAILAENPLNFDDPNEFTTTLLAAVLFALPEAEDETIEFVQSVVQPSGDFTPEQQAIQNALLFRYMDNPELEDVVDIITVLIRTEGADLQSLGKRLRAMFRAAQKMGAAPKTAR